MSLLEGAHLNLEDLILYSEFFFGYHFEVKAEFPIHT